MTKVTVAPITSTIRGLSSELVVDERNGLDHRSVVSCDNIRMIEAAELGRHLGFLLPWQEPLLAPVRFAAISGSAASSEPGECAFCR